MFLHGHFSLRVMNTIVKHGSKLKRGSCVKAKSIIVLEMLCMEWKRSHFVASLCAELAVATMANK